MRFINANTLELEGFSEREVPLYTILSHAWGSDEVSFQDMQDVSRTSKIGYEKISKCCEIAAKDGFQYV
jgi:hypothetical protein